MLKKSYCYSRNLWAGMDSLSVGNMLVLIVILTINNAVSKLEMGFWAWLMFVMLALLSNVPKAAMELPRLRIMPVSKSYAIRHILFLAPAYLLLLLNICLLGFVVLAGCVSFFTQKDYGTFISIFFGMDKWILAEWGVRLLIIFMTWPLLITSGFYSNNKKRWIAFIMSFLPMALIHILITQQLEKFEYYADYTYSEAMQLLPNDTWFLVFILFITMIGWVYAWKMSNKLYDRDIRAQKRQKQDKANEAQMMASQMYSGKKNYWAIGIAIVCLSISVVIILKVGTNIFSGGETCHIHTNNPKDYLDYYTLAEEAGIDKDFYPMNSAMLLFPESIDGYQVKSYEADISGSVGDGWCSLSWERILYVQYTEEEFAKEKERISELEITYLGQTNGVLHDSEHFPQDAYITIYDVMIQQFEYALVNEEECTIVYVFLEGKSLYEAETSLAIQPKGSQSAIVPIKKANTDQKSYSIYSFWDEKIGFFRTWNP